MSCGPWRLERHWVSAQWNEWDLVNDATGARVDGYRTMAAALLACDQLNADAAADARSETLDARPLDREHVGLPDGSSDSVTPTAQK
jgi:hypothetical protein